ncbi:hypothetical protein BD410DRAFT_549333 [Rickenella mellea]|uniref:Uncharacterized protein n=1 Tax=Rickenella mellea TaxID=50990 RepID=A0A4Y7PQP4_9AGAM|nr:hypothetical protein BD410DRAFT_549333 [Rickenella mellea]
MPPAPSTSPSQLLEPRTFHDNVEGIANDAPYINPGTAILVSFTKGSFIACIPSVLFTARTTSHHVMDQKKDLSFGTAAQASLEFVMHFRRWRWPGATVRKVLCRHFGTPQLQQNPFLLQRQLDSSLLEMHGNFKLFQTFLPALLFHFFGGKLAKGRDVCTICSIHRPTSHLSVV